MTELENNPIALLSKPWQKFFAKFQEIETLKVCKWKEIHHLAHLCKRYESLYGRKFAFSFSGAPSKCTEIVFIKKIYAMLGTTNPKVIKEYIDWVYDQKIMPKNMKIRTLAFFMAQGMGNEFLLYRVEKNKIDKSTELPREYQDIIDSMELPVSTYGDLAFIKSALEEAPDNDARAPYKQLLDKLSAIGFDFLVLKDLR